VRDAVELVSQCAVEPRMPMPMEVAPERADAVEIASTLAVDQRVAFAGDDHQRVPFGIWVKGCHMMLRSSSRRSVMQRLMTHHVIEDCAKDSTCVWYEPR